MKKTITTIIILFSILTIAKSQPYKLAAGLRLGYPASLSVKYFPSKKGSFEGFLGRRNYEWYNYTIVGAVYALYKPIDEVDGLGFFYGGGAAAYNYSWDSKYYTSRDSYTYLGLVGQLGLDYKFKDIPLNLSVDWMPAYIFGEYGDGFGYGYGALSARYVFK